MYFHHNTTKKYTTSLLNVFNDIEIPRYNKDGTVLKVINVPIVFSSRERAVQLIESDYEKYGQSQNVLPKMALSLNSIDKSPNRDTNKYNKKIYYDENNKPKSYQINSVSYNFSYTLHILARTMSDLTMIIEQILPLFRPTYNIRLKELDYQEETTSVPIELGGVSFDLPVDLSEDDDIRIISADIELTLRGNMYLPIKDTGVIEHIITNIVTNSKIVNTLEEKAYDDETVEVTDTSINLK